MAVRLEHANLTVRDVEGTIRFLQTAFPELLQVDAPHHSARITLDFYRRRAFCGKTTRVRDALALHSILPSKGIPGS
jgi:hypothetical protein